MLRNRTLIVLGSASTCAGVIWLLMAYHGAKRTVDSPWSSAPPTRFETPNHNRTRGSFPKMAFERTALDFGRRVEGEELKFRFPFRNSGRERLIVENIKTDCRCAGARASSEEVPPGGQGYIEVEVSSSPGKIQAEIVLETNALVRTHKLRITGTIEPKYVLSPSFIEFGEVQVGTTPVRRFSLSSGKGLQNPTQAPRFEVESSCEALAVRFVGDHHRASSAAAGPDAGGDFEYELLLRPGELLGYRMATVAVAIVDGTHRLVRHLTVTWTVVGNIKVCPQSGFFSLVRGERGTTADVRLLGRPEKPFAIRDIRCNSDRLTVNAREILPGKEYVLTASVTKCPLRESVKATIMVETTDEQQPLISLPARFVVFGAP